MRLDARQGYYPFDIFDVATCSKPSEAVVWVDDSTMRWGGYSGYPLTKKAQAMGLLPLSEHQEKRITIYMDRRLILFNEIDDKRSDETETPTEIIREVADATGN